MYCVSIIKNVLFRTFCTPLYTCQLLSRYTARSLHKLYVAYNNAFMMMHHLPTYCSASEMFTVNRGSIPMFPGTYVPRYRCSTNLCSPVPMFPGTDVPRFLYFNSGHYHTSFANSPHPWYDSRLGLCLGFRFRVLVRVRVRVRLELQTVFRLWLGCGLGLSLYG